MSDTTADKLSLLNTSKKDIRGAINNRLSTQSITMPEETPLSEYDVYIKMIQGGDYYTVASVEDLSTITNPRTNALAVVYDKTHNSDFVDVYIYQDSQWKSVPNVYTATANKILSGETALGALGPIEGSMPNNGTLTITPTTSQQSIPAGYTSGGTVEAVTASVDPNIVQSNIKAGVTILGVQGNVVPDKPDQTKSVTPTTSQQIIEPDTGYELASVTVNGVTAAIDANIVPGNIKAGTTILGINGILPSTDDATATADDILLPKTAYVRGVKVTGNMHTVTEPADFSLDMDDFTTNYAIYDYRPDIGYALAWDSTNSKVLILKINLDATLTQVAEITSGWRGTMSDFKFGISPMSITESGTLYNIYITGVEHYSGSNWYHSIYVVRFNVTYDTIASTPAPYLFREVSFTPHYYSGSTFYNYILPINENKIILLQRIAGNGGGTGIVANMTPAIYLLQDNAGSKIGTVPLVDSAYQNRGYGYTSSTYNSYICYATNAWGIYALNAAKSSATLLRSSTTSAWNPVLIGDYYLYDNKLYDNNNNLVKTYNNLFSATTWKYFVNGFVIEVDGSNIKIFIYNSTTQDITFDRIVTGLNLSTPTYGNATMSSFPRFVPNEAVIYSGTDVAYKSFISLPATETILQIIRGNDVYTSARGLTLLDSGNLLLGQVAQGVTGQLSGTMPNNGYLTYSPTTQEQSIPAGYTTGGVVNAAAIENTSEYSTDLTLSRSILGGDYIPHYELEYIRSTGTQYIDTNITATNDIDIEVTFKCSDTSPKYMRIYGDQTSGSYTMYMRDTSVTSWCFNGGNAVTVDATTSYRTVKYVGNIGQIYLDNVYLATATRSGNTNRKLWLFRGGDRYSKFNLQKCKIWSSGTLVRDFIPVKKSDNTVCLYDRLNDTYYYNQGTGTFTAGPVVS